MSMAKAMAKIEELTRGLAAVESLISESEGVASHLGTSYWKVVSSRTG